MDKRIIKYYQGELSPKERRDFLEKAYRDEHLKHQLIRYQQIDSLLYLQEDFANRELGKKKYKQFKQMVGYRTKLLFLKRWSKYAAVWLLSLLATWQLADYYTRSKKVVEPTINQQELYVPAGQRAELTLPDGSKVWLNANSRLSYPSSFQKERRVTLSGEGYFTVAPNKEMPFIVSTSALDIKALGTEFNVRGYPDSESVEVYLNKGIVKTYFPDAESEGKIISPGQCIIQSGDKMELTDADPDILCWREGLYVFKKQKLGYILKQLELYYDVEILVKRPEILDYEYVGKFRQRDGILTILQVIQKIHKFKIDRNDELNQIILY